MIPKHLPYIREMHSVKKIPQLLGDWQLQFLAASLQLLLDHNLPTGVWDFSFIGSSEAGASLWLRRRVSLQVQVGLSAQNDASGFSEDRLWLQVASQLTGASLPAEGGHRASK